MEILPIASGKGGVGKSVISANLAGELARLGKVIILVDFDLGAANLHTLLGLRNNSEGLGNYIYRQATSVKSLIQETGVPNLKFIAGDCLYPGTANLDLFIKKKLIKELSALRCDYVLLDLGAGSTYNTLDFYLMTGNSILVTTTEITSIMNAYSFLKAVAFRFLNRHFDAKSPESLFIQQTMQASGRGSDFSFSAVLDGLCERFPETALRARERLKLLCPRAIVNRGKTSDDLEMARRLRSLVQSKLKMHLDFIGFLPEDSAVPLSVASRTPLFLSEPASPFIEALRASAGRVASRRRGLSESFAGEGEDIELLKGEFGKGQAD